MGFHPGRRRSERLAELLDVAEGRSRRHHRRPRDPELASLVALTRRLTAATPPAPQTDEFRTGLRAMLMATIERDGIGVAAEEKSSQSAARVAALSGDTEAVKQVRAPGSGRARAAAIVGVMAGALVLSGVSAASSNSVPGDALYQVKRSTEKAQLALTGSDESKGRLYLELAFSRLREAREVGADRLDGVLADMDDETMAGVRLLTRVAVGGDDDALSAVSAFVDAQRGRLSDFAKATPVVTDDLAHSRDLLTSVANRVLDITNSLAHNCGFEASDDYLGPKPKSC